MKQKRGNNSMEGMVRQANQMQAKMKELQEELATREYTATTGGGAVKVTVKGESTIQALEISPDIFKDGDAEMLQDMVVTAVNDALATSKKDHETEMQKITGPLNIPGLF